MQQSPRNRLNANPRRVPPSQSVSLRKANSSATAPKRPASHRSSDTSSLAANRHSSGETSNVEVWFEKSNKRVGGNNPSFNDADPPFSFDRNANDSPSQEHIMTPSPLHIPLRPQLFKNDSSGSSSEEYRSVIDDLTVENKKLKQRLRRYERGHDSHLQKERLFEVKVHGLPPDKKRELEDTLRRFAASLNKSPISAVEAAPSAVYTHPTLAKAVTKPSSSLSSARIADSGYGSLATSGKTPIPHSAPRQPHVSNQFDRSQETDRNIHSYLHDIPEGLLPKQSNVLTEKSKKKLVVRRLEQIFGGRRGSDPSLHQQPIQQQEVSQSAANADRTDLEARGQKAKAEGIREARIMDSETEDVMEPSESAPKAFQGSVTAAPQDKTREFQDRSSAASPRPEQRPTRPLDLDPHRAQDPSENIEYIRHLGFLDSEGSPTLPPVDGQSWIYLNLLVSMAQLHTINVTTDFVKKALAEYSSKIELSSDGRKVRWRQNEGAMLSSDSSPDIHHDSTAANEDHSGVKRTRPWYLESPRAVMGHVPKKQALQSSGLKGKFAYTPLFSHQDSSDDDSDGSMCEDDYFPSSHDVQGQNGLSTLDGTKARQSSSTTPINGGAMIFYNNATFCTDLSGDNSMPLHRNSTIRRQSWTPTPLGAAQKKTPSVHSSLKDSASTIFDVSELSTSLDLASRPKIDLHFPSPRASPKHVSFAEPENSMPLEASGIGGVMPEDNMTITVVRRCEPTSPTSKTKARSKASRLSGILSQRSQAKTAGVAERVISARRRKIDPSPLPPASLHFGVEESDSDSDSGSDASSAELRRRLAGKGGLLAQTSSSPQERAASPLVDENMGNASSEYGDDDEEDDEEEDQSLDFLATARAAHPEAVRAKEREYDAAIAERLAEEIPAGSSAATAGGGSGFTSPTELVKPKDDDESETDEERSVSS